jgi:hypothetical protein
MTAQNQTHSHHPRTAHFGSLRSAVNVHWPAGPGDQATKIQKSKDLAEMVLKRR